MSAGRGSTLTRSADLIVDASVIIKWHLVEIHGKAARRLLGDDAPVPPVPDLMFPEAGNVLWKKTRRGELTKEEAQAIAHLVSVAPPRCPPLGTATGGGDRDRYGHRADRL